MPTTKYTALSKPARLWLQFLLWRTERKIAQEQHVLARVEGEAHSFRCNLNSYIHRACDIRTRLNLG